jgi:formylmethanofuran dehydrogenase subunit E
MFETFTCEQCGEEFAAHPSARAAKNGLCSPACESAAKGF